MDLDSRIYSKLIDANNTYGGSEEYIRILVAILPLTKKCDYETPEMWCSRICGLFRKILEENPRILSKNGYIIMYGKLYENDKVYTNRTNYIYCSVCDSLVFIPETFYSNHRNHDSHLKRCIYGSTISNEHVRRNEILQTIDRREFQIWQYKQYILQEEAKINHLQLELSFPSILHSEKDKLASVSYDSDGNFMASYKHYAQSKATVAKNTMPSAPNFEPAYILPSGQEIISPTSYQSSNCKIIQQAYRNYKKKAESLAKWIWEVVRNDDTPDRKKFLGILKKGQMVINPETQKEYVIACEEFYAYFRKYYSKYIGIINPIKLTPPYEEYIYCSPSRWIEAKKYQLERQLNRPLNIIRIFTALFVRLEQGEWTGVLEKEVENFENVLERVLEQVLSEDVE
ncbi:hypothetical protein C1645_812683 [Glomus cerebriforme]|uniref:Uncharacterized protein n=1 Tax=Glomus cerebriforme TaxID=658196 RepID=A0A397TU44_9GLOM|nr:hypothetical protein C1645_812683 [Glomus cerebriforme]